MKGGIINNNNETEIEQLDSNMINLSTPSKYSYSPINNLFQDFSQNITNSQLKNISFEELISLTTSKKKKTNITNDTIIDEIKNKIFQYNQILNFKMNQSEYYHKEFENFKVIYKKYFQSLTNFSVENYQKLLKDFEQIKKAFEQNLKKNADSDEWEILNHSIINFSEFLHNNLDNVNYQLDLEGIMQKIMDLSNKIKLDKKDNNSNLNEENYLVSNKKMFDFGNNNFDNELKQNTIIYYKDKKNKFSENSFSFEKIGKLNKTSKIIKVVLYFNKNENNNFIQNIINILKDSFLKYIIYYFDKNTIQIFSSFKISFVGKCKSILEIKKLIKDIIIQSQNKIIIKLIFCDSFKEILLKTIKKLKYSNSNYYYTSNIKRNILNKL